MKFIDTAKFMASSLSNLVDNLAEGIQKIECKDCDCFREYESFSDDLRKHKCLSCNRDYSNKLDEKFKKRFKNTFKFSNNDIYKLILLFMKKHYLIKNNLIAASVWKILQMQITCIQKEFEKTLK